MNKATVSSITTENSSAALNPSKRQSTKNPVSIRQKREPNLESQETITNGRNTYRIGQEIGRGGFAVVFQAFTVETGDFVAVKRFPLHTIDDDSLGSIESEIELMKKLNHPNIVKYVDTIRTTNSLHIILEYMENGSLANVIKRFGSFSESLTAIYVSQVLRGLKYLHEQGVLHRDIKGANLLATKEGLVKLADFGVAMKLSEVNNSDHDVVGTPYWMAPEVIEMSTPTVACDIWSVGCTIIELLTGKPPYFDLQPMAALFRIVQDDQPPLPPGISQALRDFLTLCFNKVPIMRSTATNLLNHPWLQNPTNHIIHTSSELVNSSTNELNSTDIDNNNNLTHNNNSGGNSSNNVDNKILSQSTSNNNNNNNNNSMDDNTTNSKRFYIESAIKIYKKDNGINTSTHIPPATPAIPNQKPSTSTLITGNTTTEVTRKSPFSSSFSSSGNSSLSTTNNNSNHPPSKPSPAIDPNPTIICSKLNNETIKSNSILVRPSSTFGVDLDDSPPPSSSSYLLPSLKKTTSTVAMTSSTKAAKSPIENEDDEDWDKEFDDNKKYLESSRNTSLSSKSNLTINNNTIQTNQSEEDNIPTIKLKSTYKPPLIPSSSTAVLTAVLPVPPPLSLSPYPQPFTHSSSNSSSSSYSNSIKPITKSTPTKNDKLKYSVASSSQKELISHKISQGSRRSLQPGDVDVHHSTSHRRQQTTHQVANTIPSTLLKYQEDEDDDIQFSDFGDFDDSSDSSQKSTSRNNNSRNDNTGHSSEKKNKLTAQNLKLRMQKSTAEQGDDSTFDEFLSKQFDETDFIQNESKDVHLRRSRKILTIMEQISPSTDEDVVIKLCDSLLQLFSQYPEQREYLIMQYGVLPILDMLDSRSGIGHRPSVPILDMLDVKSGVVRPDVLRVINKIVEGSTRAQEQLSLVGLIPIIIRVLENTPHPGQGYTSGTTVDPVTLEAAKFLHQISSTSSLTLQMLIGAGGLPVLVQMVSFSTLMPKTRLGNNQQSTIPKISNIQNSTSLLTSNQNSYYSLLYPNSLIDDSCQMVFMGIDCIVQVFKVQSSRSRDFCRLFVKFCLLNHLSTAFRNLMLLYYSNNSNGPESFLSNYLNNSQSLNTTTNDSATSNNNNDNNNVESKKEPIELHYAYHISGIFLHFSRSDPLVVEQMAKEGVLHAISEVLKSPTISNSEALPKYLAKTGSIGLSPMYIKIIEFLLKCIQNMSMDPSSLQMLEDIEAIPTLINLLNGPICERCKNHVLPCIFNLCRINKRRQELAARNGIIPHLQQLITDNSHLRQFALPIIFELAHNGPVCRRELKKHDGVLFYLSLLREKYWNTFALNALATWLANEIPPITNVEDILVDKKSVEIIISFFASISSVDINTLHKPFLDLMSKSKKLCTALGGSSRFIEELIKKLKVSEAIILRSLLKMIQYIHQYHPRPRELVLDYGLYDIIKVFVNDEKQVLVYQIATRLLRDLHQSTLS